MERCPICLESDFDVVGAIDSCDHEYCADCISSWSEKSDACPLCKQTYTTIKNVDAKSRKTMSTKKVEPMRVRTRLLLDGMDDFHDAIARMIARSIPALFRGDADEIEDDDDDDFSAFHAIVSRFAQVRGIDGGGGGAGFHVQFNPMRRRLVRPRSSEDGAGGWSCDVCGSRNHSDAHVANCGVCGIPPTWTGNASLRTLERTGTPEAPIDLSVDAAVDEDDVDDEPPKKKKQGKKQKTPAVPPKKKKTPAVTDNKKKKTKRRRTKRN